MSELTGTGGQIMLASSLLVLVLAALIVWLVRPGHRSESAWSATGGQPLREELEAEFAEATAAILALPETRWANEDGECLRMRLAAVTSRVLDGPDEIPLIIGHDVVGAVKAVGAAAVAVAAEPDSAVAASFLNGAIERLEQAAEVLPASGGPN